MSATERNSSERPDLDLTISRVIRAPRSVVWSAWTDRVSFEQWWVPAPAVCKVLDLDLWPGGAFLTQISEDLAHAPANRSRRSPPLDHMDEAEDAR